MLLIAFFLLGKFQFDEGDDFFFKVKIAGGKFLRYDKLAFSMGSFKINDCF